MKHKRGSCVLGNSESDHTQSSHSFCSAGWGRGAGGTDPRPGPLAPAVSALWHLCLCRLPIHIRVGQRGTVPTWDGRLHLGPSFSVVPCQVPCWVPLPCYRCCGRNWSPWVGLPKADACRVSPWKGPCETSSLPGPAGPLGAPGMTPEHNLKAKAGEEVKTVLFSEQWLPVQMPR